jgi:twinkle protein
MAKNKLPPFGNFIQHKECPLCGSSDALSEFDSGHEYCYSCNTLVTFPGKDGTPKKAKASSGNGIPLLQAEAIQLKARGISQETCRKFNYHVGKDEKGNWVHIANYFKERQLVAQHLRGEDKKFSWRGDSKDVELFGQNIWPAKGSRVVVTEGEIDCMSISQSFNNKWPCVSIPSGCNSARSAIERNIEWLEGYESIVLAFDDDAPGRKATEDAVLLFTPGKVKVMSFQGLKDANELLLAKDASTVCSCVFQAREYRPDGVVSGCDLLDEVMKEPQSGYSVLYPKLMEKTMGLRKGELVMFTAGSGIGKSTVVNEIAYDLMMRHKLSIGIVALEESKKRTAERYISIRMNKPIHLTREGVTNEEIKEAFDATVGTGRFWLYDHWGSLQVDTLLAKLQFMVISCKVDFIILDHISIIVSGLAESEESERKTLDRLMTALRQLVERTGVGMLAVVHLKRPKDGKSYNEGRQVSLTDLRGSASLEQISDMVIALERDQQDDNDEDSQGEAEESNISVIRVLKNRPIGKTGVADTLSYCHETGRLSVVDNHNEYFPTRKKKGKGNKPVTHNNPGF